MYLVVEIVGVRSRAADIAEESQTLDKGREGRLGVKQKKSSWE